MLCCPRGGSAQKFSSLPHFTTKSTADRNGLWSSDRLIGKGKHSLAFFSSHLWLYPLLAFPLFALNFAQQGPELWISQFQQNQQWKQMDCEVMLGQLHTHKKTLLSTPQCSCPLVFYFAQWATFKTIICITTLLNICSLTAVKQQQSKNKKYSSPITSPTPFPPRSPSLVRIYSSSLPLSLSHSFPFLSSSPPFLRMCSFTTTCCVSTEMISAAEQKHEHHQRATSTHDHNDPYDNHLQLNTTVVPYIQWH